MQKSVCCAVVLFCLSLFGALEAASTAPADAKPAEASVAAQPTQGSTDALAQALAPIAAGIVAAHEAEKAKETEQPSLTPPTTPGTDAPVGVTPAVVKDKKTLIRERILKFKQERAAKIAAAKLAKQKDQVSPVKESVPLTPSTVQKAPVKKFVAQPKGSRMRSRHTRGARPQRVTSVTKARKAAQGMPAEQVTAKKKAQQDALARMRAARKTEPVKQ